MTIKAFVFDAYGTLYDVHSIFGAAERAFPGRGEAITQIWRLKQLEYSWLRSLIGQYQDFRAVTGDSLSYTLDILGLTADAATMAMLVDAYDHLTPYPEAKAALGQLKAYRRAILSNGSQPMLDALVRNTGLADELDAVISVDAARVFKPDPRTYELVLQRLGVAPAEVMFVTSNGFDVAGARAFGFNVARVVRVPLPALQEELNAGTPIGASLMYKALRSQNERLGYSPTIEVSSLSELAGVAG